MKKVLKLAYLLLFLFFLVGCWDADELDSLFIVSGIAVDKSETEGYIDVTIQVIKTTPAGGKDKSAKGNSNEDVIVLKQTQKTVLSAIEVLNYNNNRNIFLQHNQIILIGKDIAEAGLNNNVDFFIRDTRTRMETLLLIVDGRADEVLKAQIDQDPNTGNFLYHQINNIIKSSKFFLSTLLNYTSKSLEKQSALILPMIKLTEEAAVEGGSEKNSQINVNGMAIFRDDKLTTMLNSKQVLAYLWFCGEVSNSWLEFQSELGTFVLKIYTVKTEKEFSIENDKVKLYVKLYANMSVGELRDISVINALELVERLPKEVEKELWLRLTEIFKLSQSESLDIFNIGIMIERKQPSKWALIKDDWNKIYSNIELIVEPKVVITGLGQIIKSLEMENAS